MRVAPALASAGAVLALGAGALVAPAQADPPPSGLFVRLVSLNTDRAVIQARCPVDPPTNAIIFTHPLGGGGQVILTDPVNCNTRLQTFSVPVNLTTLTPGEVLSPVVVQISGDGGEINQFLDSVTVR